MTTCTFDSPQLVTALAGGVVPTFAYSSANTNYFGISGSFTRSGTICSFPTKAGIIISSKNTLLPSIILPNHQTVTCNPLTPASTGSGQGYTTFNGIACPSLTDNNKLATGSYTLKFSEPTGPSVTSRVFIIGSPTSMIDYVTATITQTSTIAGGPASTTTETSVTATVTSATTLPAEPAETSTETTYLQTVTEVTTLDPTETAATITETFSTTSTQTVLNTDCPSSSTSSSDPTPTPTLKVSEDGACGGTTGQTCLGSTFGNCCSEHGWCGATDAYCAAGCQSGFGTCNPTSTTSSTEPTSTSKVSKDGTCGGTNGYTCPGSGFGDCCSEYGWCGSSDSHCGAGCQLTFGTCSTTTTSSAQPTSTVKVSKDGSCGGTNGYVCTGSGFGDCCSQYGWCGSSTGHCGAGCQSPFGTCDPSASSTLVTVTVPPVPTASNGMKISQDGTCGGTGGQTCLGSTFGNCCSQYGYCGSSTAHCQNGCQLLYGTCGTSSKVKRARDADGPDFTYPPIPTVTSTRATSTKLTTVTGEGSGVSTKTVLTDTTVQVTVTPPPQGALTTTVTLDATTVFSTKTPPDVTPVTVSTTLTDVTTVTELDPTCTA